MLASDEWWGENTGEEAYGMLEKADLLDWNINSKFWKTNLKYKAH